MSAVLHNYDDLTGIADQAKLIERIAGLNCTPGWIPRARPLMWPAPRPEMVPAHWRYSEIKPGLLAAGRVIGTDLAERRNFVLRNPAPGNDFATTRTLVGAYQSILPGERARSHRHSSHALRVILDSRGSYSVVDGKQHPMETGDIVLTPGGSWHGHGHAGSEQAYWFDCLDLPLVQLLEPMTAQDHPQHWEQNIVAEPHSPMRLEWRETLRKLDASTDASALFGTTVDLSSDLMRTITIKAHRWARGWANPPYRQYANTLYVVLQGSGKSVIGDDRYAWNFGDVIAVPMGIRVAHTVSADAIMVALSDEALMRYCGYYKLEECA
jgi:gentisate 1,2-dioxygenase